MNVAPKFTPGPWVRFADTNVIIRLHSGGPHHEDLRVCEVSVNTRRDEGRHNGNLIAAAPDLYAALVAILPWIPPAHAKMSMVASSKQLDAANAVRAALAKVDA